MEKDKKGSRKSPKPKSRKSNSVFETLLNEDFFLLTKDHPLPKVKKLRKSDWLSICLCAARNKLIQFWCELWDHYVFLRPSKDKQVIAFMDIKWARIKMIIDDDVGGKEVSCIKFSKFRSYEELFHNDLNTMVSWF